MTHPETGPYIRCEDLFKIYKVADLEVVALRGLDLKVERGEVIAIVGASGSGKSTLLNILAGYDTPSAGRVAVGDRDLLRMTGKEVELYRREEVGFIWQQTSRNMFPYLSAVENVALPMMLTNTPSGNRQKRAEELMDMVGLGHRMGHTPEKLSGGEQQRVAVARALAAEPGLLLADEPSGNLDAQTSEELHDLLFRLRESQGLGMVLVTHNKELAGRADRILELKDGQLHDAVRA